LEETPFLPVSESVKRAMRKAKAALVQQGYRVVDFNITPEEFSTPRNCIMGMCSYACAPMARDCYNEGENLLPLVAQNFWLMQSGPLTRWFLRKAMGMMGMGRAREFT